jgi:hypothetical protein
MFAQKEIDEMIQVNVSKFRSKYYSFFARVILVIEKIFVKVRRIIIIKKQGK